MRNTDESVEQLVERAGALLGPDHFRLRSGRHSRYYFDKEILIARPHLLDQLAFKLASKFTGSQVQVVIGPPLGGIILAFEVARNLTLLYSNREVKTVFTRDGRFSDYFRGLIKGQRVALVDDTVTTGDSISELRHQVIESGGRVVGLGVICNRRQLRAEDVKIAPFYWLFDLPIEDWPVDGCPMCREGILLNTAVGHSQECRERQLQDLSTE